MKQIVAHKNMLAKLIVVADALDDNNLHEEADKLTRISQRLAQNNFFESLGNGGTMEKTFFPDMFNNECKHESVKYEGNDGEQEPFRECFGTCENCGAEMVGYEEVDGFTEEGGLEYAVKEWKQA